MSTRDDQHATVPPPAGEDDAYSATTKVGAMPPDIMEKLRAEGLLPEEPAKKPEREVPRPSTSLEQRKPLVSAPPASSDGSSGASVVPQLYSTAPPAMSKDHAATAAPPPNVDGDRESQSKILTAKPPPPTDAETPIAEAVETPVAFAAPPVPTFDEPRVSEPAEETKDTTALTTQTKEKAAQKAPSKVTMVVVAVLVVVLLVVALMRLRG